MCSLVRMLTTLTLALGRRATIALAGLLLALPLAACASTADGDDTAAEGDDTAQSADALKNPGALCAPWSTYVSPERHSFYFACRRSFFQEPNQDGSKWRAAARCCTEAGCNKVVGTVQPYAGSSKSVGYCSGYVSNVHMEYWPKSCNYGGCADPWR